MTDRQRPELYALLATLLLGVPLVYLFAGSLADGFSRHREAPLRAVMGSERYEALSRGEGGVPHYLGNDLAAPNFTLKDRRGKPWTLRDHRGKVVVLNFWSITCRPCVQEMPTLEVLAQIAEEWGDVEVVAVSTDSGFDAVKSILPPSPRLTHLFDPDRAVVQGKFGTKLYPETWVVDRAGVIRFRYDGALDWSRPLILDLISSFR